MSNKNRELQQVEDLSIDAIKGHRDVRGILYTAELNSLIGFAPVRLFWITDVPEGHVRGEHGHRLCQQYLVCCSGKVTVDAYDGSTTRAIPLEHGQGLLIRPGIFATLQFADPKTLLLVLCSHAYDPDDYLRSRDAVVAFRANANP